MVFKCVLRIKCGQVWQQYTNSCMNEASGIFWWSSRTSWAIRRAPACQNSMWNTNLKSLLPSTVEPLPPLRHAHQLVFLPHDVQHGRVWVLSAHLPSSLCLCICATPEYHITHISSSAILSTTKGFSRLCIAMAIQMQHSGPPPTSSLLWWEGVTLTSLWLILAWGKALR